MPFPPNAPLPEPPPKRPSVIIEIEGDFYCALNIVAIVMEGETGLSVVLNGQAECEKYYTFDTSGQAKQAQLEAVREWRTATGR